MKRMGWSWSDLQEAPVVMVEAVLLDAIADGNAAATREQWARR